MKNQHELGYEILTDEEFGDRQDNDTVLCWWTNDKEHLKSTPVTLCYNLNSFKESDLHHAWFLINTWIKLEDNHGCFEIWCQRLHPHRVCLHLLVHCQLQQWCPGQDHPLTVPVSHDLCHGAVVIHSNLVTTTTQGKKYLSIIKNQRLTYLPLCRS